MKQRWLLVVLVVVLSILIAGCQPADTKSDTVPTSVPTDGAGLPNPAAAFCQDQGYKYEIRTAADGSQSGVCIFADGSECDEWAFYRSECGPKAGGE